MKKSFVMVIAFAIAGIVQQGCMESPTSKNSANSPAIVGAWTCGANADLRTGTIYHNSSAYGSTHADTTFVANDLTGSSLNFSSGGTVAMSFDFFGSPLTLNGTWSYSDADSNLTMKISGTSVWPTSRTGKLSVSNTIATITYVVPADTLSHGVSTFGMTSDTTSDVFIGTEVVKMGK